MSLLLAETGTSAFRHFSPSSCANGIGGGFSFRSVRRGHTKHDQDSRLSVNEDVSKNWRFRFTRTIDRADWFIPFIVNLYFTTIVIIVGCAEFKTRLTPLPSFKFGAVMAMFNFNLIQHADVKIFFDPSIWIRRGHRRLSSNLGIQVSRIMRFPYRVSGFR